MRPPRVFVVALALCASIVACKGPGPLPSEMAGADLGAPSEVTNAAGAGKYLYVADQAEHAVVRYPVVSGKAAAPDAELYLASRGVTSVDGIAVDSRGQVYVGVRASGESHGYKILVFAAGSGGGAFPSRTIDVSGLAASIAVDARGFVYATGQRGIDVYPPSGSTAPVRHIDDGARLLALDEAGTLYALVDAHASSTVDVYDTRLKLARRICLGGETIAGISVSEGRVYVARHSAAGSDVVWFDASTNGCPARAPQGVIRSSTPGFDPQGIAASGNRLFAVSGHAIDVFDANRSGAQKPSIVDALLHVPSAVAVGAGGSVSATETITLTPTMRSLLLPQVGGFRERMLLPQVHGKSGVKLHVSISTASLPAQAPADAMRGASATAYSPLLETSVTAEGAAQLVNSPGFTIALPTSPPGNVEFFLSIFAPDDPASSWFVGPGVPTGNQAVNFSLGGTGTGLTFSAGESYEFELYALVVTSSTPTPMPSSGAITEFPVGSSVVPAAGPVAGPGGNAWFLVQSTVGSSGYSVDSITKAGVLATNALQPSDIHSLAPGPDGNIWLSSAMSGGGGFLGAQILKETPAGVTTIYPIACPPSGGDCSGGDIATDNGGNLWMTDNIVESASTPGYVFEIGTAGQLLQTVALGAGVIPGPIVDGPDGALLIAGQSATAGGPATIQHVTTAGQVTQIDVPTFPIAMTVGQDGNVWFPDGDNIDRVTPQGVVTKFFAAGGAVTGGIATAADGTFWFVEDGTNAIGHMDEKGVILGQYAVPTANAGLSGICITPDGSVWFSELFTQSGGGATFSTGMAVLTPPSNATRSRTRSISALRR